MCWLAEGGYDNFASQVETDLTSFARLSRPHIKGNPHTSLVFLRLGENPSTASKRNHQRSLVFVAKRLLQSAPADAGGAPAVSNLLPAR